MTDSEFHTIFPAHPAYRWLALSSGVVALLLMWELRQGLTWGMAGGSVVALAAAGYWGRLALCRVELSATQVQLVAPAAAPRRVERRQIAQVYAEGRLLPAALVLYHPRRADGLFDHEELRSLSLPAVVGLDDLVAALGGESMEHPGR